ncbi:MAG: sensor histidine kinase [Gammaproteobacteria bacterium]
MKIAREYKKSSSFKVANLFLLLLLFSTACLSAALYFYLQSTSDDSQNVVVVLIIAGVVPLLMLVIAGYLISIFVVTRINRIADTADEIMSTGDLTKRLKVDSRWDDLSFLSQVLNSMLDKIEKLMSGVQHITDTIAHDLRTPLARLRNKLDAQQDEQLVTEVDGLLKTFNSLLSLSSIESGRQPLKFVEFDLQKLIEDAVGLYDPLAQEKSQCITIKTQPASYIGDRDLMFQVIANLLDNAIKFTSEGGVINVKMEPYKRGCKVHIDDNGPGIPLESRHKVFERFYRDPSQQSQQGAGLGLSLVSAVLELHDANIQLVENKSGLRVTLDL